MLLTNGSFSLTQCILSYPAAYISAGIGCFDELVKTAEAEESRKGMWKKSVILNSPFNISVCLYSQKPVKRHAAHTADEGTFDIEKILDKRMKRRQVQYLVKWEGYDDMENTWEPDENLPENMVRQYEKKRGKQT